MRRPRRTHRALIVLATTLASALPGWAGSAQAQPSIPIGEKHLQIDGRGVRSAAITTSPEPIPADLAGIEMLRERLGGVASLDSRSVSSINRLSRVLEGHAPLSDTGLFIHFAGDAEPVTMALFTRAETVIIQSVDDPARAWSVRREAFDRLGIPLEVPASSPAGGFNPTGTPLEMTIPTPHTESDLVLDTRTVRSRIKNNFPSLTREVGGETFHVRLPARFDPDTPAGVLVCISPTPSGRIHPSFAQACDQLGLIAIGVDNNGNNRPITDRLQNHLDSIETLAGHARIDRDRIYLTGMSGGGRCSSILLLSFPERFAGAVPIVGLDTYHNAPTGKPNQHWPRALGKPAGTYLRLLRDRRIRSITGTADFNEPEMVIRTELMQRDGLDATIDVIEGMAHTYPTGEQFRDALLWVDEPQRAAMEKALSDARATLERTEGADTDAPAVRRQLIQIMQLLPHSDEAWQAAARLGYPRTDA